MKMTALHELLLARSQLENGYGNAEVKGHEQIDVCRATEALKRHKLVFSGKRGHRTVRYFSTAARAKEFQDAATIANQARKKPALRPWGPEVEAIYPPDRTLITTYGPAPTGRVLWTNTHSQFA